MISFSVKNVMAGLKMNSIMSHHNQLMGRDKI